MAYSPYVILGVELELEIQNDPKWNTSYTTKYLPRYYSQNYVHQRHGDLVRIISQETNDWVKVGYDGTLVDGFELRGEPGTLNENRDYWTRLLEHPELSRYIHGEDVETAGMHVHMSGDPITPLILGKMVHFINKVDHREFIHKIAGRSGSQWAVFMDDRKISDLSSLHHSSECTRGGKRKILYQETGGINCCKGVQKFNGKGFKRGATFVTPKEEKGVLEIRLFKSAVKKPRFLSNLDFCVALVDFCHIAPPAALSHRAFIKWLDLPVNRHKYPWLYKFLREQSYVKGLIPFRKTLKEKILQGKVEQRALMLVK